MNPMVVVLLAAGLGVALHESKKNSGPSFPLPGSRATVAGSDNEVTNKLNLRAQPNTDSPIVANLAMGETVTLLDVAVTDQAYPTSVVADLVKVSTADGSTGWCYVGKLK